MIDRLGRSYIRESVINHMTKNVIRHTLTMVDGSSEIIFQNQLIKL